MKDIYYYAEKNGLGLLDHGNCQLCGSKASRGIFECHENFCLISEKLNFSDPNNHLSRFLCVDSMALQHTEVHGPGSNYLHLTRLYLILVEKNLWTYKKTPDLSRTFNSFKRNQYIGLTPPPAAERGQITSFDVSAASNTEETLSLIRMWANSVFDAYRAHHARVEILAKEYLRQHY